MARPTKFNPVTAEKVINLVRAGNYRETAAAAVGITPKTLRNWLARGAKSGKANEPYARFSESLDNAEAEAEVRDNKKISDAAENDWRAAAWRLARKSPDRWGERTRLEHSGPDGGPIETKAAAVVLLPPEDPDPEEEAERDADADADEREAKLTAEYRAEREEPGDDGAEPEAN